MKRALLASLVIYFFVFSAHTGYSADGGLKAEAVKNLQKAVIKALPAEGNIIRIAILDLAGDDGTLKNAITSVIAEKTSFKIIERADLDQILKEQGLQLKDVMDEKTRIQHGKIKGVQGLLMGSVLGMESGFMSYTIRAHLKLDDVEKGEIVFARDFNVTAVSPVRNWIFSIAGLVIMVLLAVIVFGRRRVVVKEKIIEEDTRTRVDLGKGVGRALSTLSAAKAKLMDQGHTEMAVKFKEAERNLLALKEEIENAPRGSTDMRDKRAFKEVLECDRNFLQTADALTKTADRLSEAVSAGDADLEQRLDQMRRDIRIAADAFKSRKI